MSDTVLLLDVMDTIVWDPYRLMPDFFGMDWRELMRAGISDDALEAVLRDMVWNNVAGHEADESGDRFRAFEGVMTQVGG